MHKRWKNDLKLIILMLLLVMRYDAREKTAFQPQKRVAHPIKKA